MDIKMLLLFWYVESVKFTREHRAIRQTNDALPIMVVSELRRFDKSGQGANELSTYFCFEVWE